MRLAHDAEALAALRTPSVEEPLRVLVSGCLAGLSCGVDATDYGLGALMHDFLAAKTLVAFRFCPEDVGMGTPRTMPDIHGGDGYDVLDGRARVVDEHGTDLTEKMLTGAQGMLACALENRVELAVLTDMSAACGSQVISDGCRLVESRRFHASVGVAAALLLRSAIPVVSQRDAKTIGILRERLDPGYRRDPAALDYHQTPWYLTQFANGRP
jgi:uncharacterized protein YbbK (DUF523 family)